MATINQDNATIQNGPVTLTRTTMTASDTLTYSPGARQMLFLYNTTASAVNITITGSTATSVNVPGYGSVSVAAGKVVSVPASQSVLVDLDDISAYLSGTITLTNGTGVTAHLFT
jgi:hypothetical protein